MECYSALKRNTILVHCSYLHKETALQTFNLHLSEEEAILLFYLFLSIPTPTPYPKLAAAYVTYVDGTWFGFHWPTF